MSNDDRHLALPKLYGQPAYARPVVTPAQPTERPFDPDDLPLEADRVDADSLAANQEPPPRVEARPYAGGDAGEPLGPATRGPREGSPMLRGRPFRLRSLGSRIGRDDGSSAA